MGLLRYPELKKTVFIKCLYVCKLHVLYKNTDFAHNMYLALEPKLLTIFLINWHNKFTLGTLYQNIRIRNLF